jgi:hypothetical protein
MIHHLVLLHFKAGVTSQQIADAGRGMTALKGIITEIRAMSWHPNLGPSANEYPWVLLVRCDDMNAVQRYLDHPEHVAAVAKWLGPIRDARLAIDIEAS